MKLSILVFGVILIIGFANTSLHGQDKAELNSAALSWQDQIKELVEGEIVEEKLPSLQVAIGKDGALLFEEGYGFANLEHQVKATALTKYRTASISKWLTGTAVMSLVEDGLLDLEKPVQEYCPQYPEKQWSINTKQLLSHSAGIRNYANHYAMLAQATDESRDEIEAWVNKDRLTTYTRFTDVIKPLDSFKDDPLIFEPGTDHQYTSFGYRLIACVMQGAAKENYRKIMQERIFDPLEMVNTVDDDALDIIPHRAATYQRRNSGLSRANFRDISENLPAGGHLSTAGDLVKFAMAFNAGKLVGKESIAAMSQQPLDKEGNEMNVGYGHGVDLIGGFPNSLGHSGSQQGSSTLIVLLPEQDIAVAVLCNASSWRDAKVIVQGILDIVDGEFGK